MQLSQRSTTRGCYPQTTSTQVDSEAFRAAERSFPTLTLHQYVAAARCSAQ